MSATETFQLYGLRLVRKSMHRTQVEVSELTNGKFNRGQIQAIERNSPTDTKMDATEL